MSSFTAHYFDGRSPGGLRVKVSAAGDRLTVSGRGIERHFHLGEVQIGSQPGAGSHRIRFADGANLVIADNAALTGLLNRQTPESAGGKPGFKPSAFGLSLAVALLLALAGYRWGIPQLLDCFSEDLPKPVLVALSDRVLTELDASSLAPSLVSPKRQAEVVQQFASLRRPASDPPFQILFRRGREAGAHALALPDGRLLLTDDMLNLAEGQKDGLLALLLHESRHVVLRHGLRSLLADSLPVTLSAWSVGDISGLLARAPAVSLKAAYPLSFEQEADRQTTQLLLANGLPIAAWESLLVKLQAETLLHPGARRWAGDFIADADGNRRLLRLEALRR